MERFYPRGDNHEIDWHDLNLDMDTGLFKTSIDPRAELVKNSLQNLRRRYEKLEARPGGIFSSFKLLGNLQILGIAPPDYLQSDIKKGFDLTDRFTRESYFRGNEQTTGNLLSDMAGAKLIGMGITISDEDTRLIQEWQTKDSNYDGYVNDLLYHTSFGTGSRDNLVNAAIIGIDVPLDEEKKRQLKHRLVAKQQLEMREYDDYIHGRPDLDGNVYEEGCDFDGLYGQYNLMLSSGLASARILGIDVPVFQFTMNMLKKRLKNRQEPYYEAHAANYAINAATEIRVGGDKGLQLEF